MNPNSPAGADTDAVLAFVTSALPPGASVLEIGAGDGRLAARLAAAGWRVKAIDVDAEAVAAARARGVDADRVDFFAFGGERFDALLFTRSFHHLAPLAAAVARCGELVAPGGTLLFDEFAHDEMDMATAAWFFDVLALLEAAGSLGPEPPRGHHHGHREEPTPPPTPLARWQRRVAHEPPLHGARAMMNALSGAFAIERVDRLPYLYRYLVQRLAPDEQGARVFERVRGLEEERLAIGLLVPIGLRLVCRAPCGSAAGAIMEARRRRRR